ISTAWLRVVVHDGVVRCVRALLRFNAPRTRRGRLGREQRLVAHIPLHLVAEPLLDIFILFFFSSRRRHTRSKRDWSSDVCSSDLMAGWLAKVKEESKSEDIKVRTKWARDLESYVTNFVSEETGKPYSFKSRKVAVSAVRSFLYENVGQKTLEPYRFTLQSSEERLRAEQAKEDFVPISVDDYRKLVLGANTIRDRAILLSLPGMGVGEWLQFAHDCTTKYLDAIRNLKVPTRVAVVRPKNKQHYSVELWDDSMEYLRLLLLEREKEVGHSLGPSDQLFVSTYGDPITSHRVQHMVRFLADKLGLEKREKGKIIYKFRPHEIGRDFFRTLCDNQGVPEKIAEYSLGHK